MATLFHLMNRFLAILVTFPSFIFSNLQTAMPAPVSRRAGTVTSNSANSSKVLTNEIIFRQTVILKFAGLVSDDVSQNFTRGFLTQSHYYYYYSITDHDTDKDDWNHSYASNSSGSVSNEDSGTVHSKIVFHQIQGTVGSQQIHEPVHHHPHTH